MNRLSRVLLAGLVCLLLTLPAAAAQPAKPLSLAGTWRVRLDPQDVGQEQKWFDAAMPKTATLPGSLTSNGLGDDVTVDTEWTGQIVDRSWYDDPKYAEYRKPGNVKVPFWLTPVKHYVGPAWYGREIDVPEAWKGKHVTLLLERVHWESQVWVDDRHVGMHNSLSTPHLYDLGPLAPGKHRLAIRVDNRVKIDVGINAHSVTDHTQTNWNGIVGRIELAARAPVWIDDVQAFPDAKRKTAKVRVKLANATGRPVYGVLTFAAEPSHVPGNPPFSPAACGGSDPGTSARAKRPLVDNAELKKRAAISMPGISIPGETATAEFDYPMPENAQPWDEFHPAVYTMNVSLEAQAAGQPYSDRAAVDFGLRDFTVQGTRFACNGRPVFLRGTLECCIFPLTGYPPTDVASWTRILKVARAHGLNHLRFHSWCPPEAAFVAADRMGFMYQIECAVWTKVGVNPATDAFIYAETERILRAYGNHPSFCLLSHGNEPGGRNKEFLAKWVDHFKAADPRRLYTAGSGWPAIPENQYHVTPAPRIQAWGGGLHSRVNARPPETTTDYRDFVAKYPHTPVVSHEIGQWCVYPNFDEIKKYTGVTRAYNFEIFRDTLRANHMLDQAHRFLTASGKLQALLYKEEIESALRTPGMAGLELLDLHDFPGQGTALVGVLDPFWDSKGYVTPEEYHRFACETVPLARLEKRTWTADETFAADVEIAHFGPRPIEGARPQWIITGQGGQPVASGKLAARTIPWGNGIKLGRVTLPLKGVKAPQKLVLGVALAGTEYANDWDFWVYPAKVDTAAPQDVLVVDALNEKALAALKAGGRVMLLPARGSVKGDRYGKVPPGFSSIFWNTAWTRRQAPHTLGILCDPAHPALADFPTEYHSNWQWWDPVAHSQIMILDDLPAEVRPIVQVIDDWFTNRRLGLVFEARVGGGRLLVCGIDLADDLDARPVARQMRASLLRYMAGPSFAPKQDVDLRVIQGLFAPPPALQRLGAKILRADSQSRGYEAAKAIDGDPATCWHTAWEGASPPHPHELVVELGREATLRGFRYLPRQDMSNGRVARYAFYTSRDGRQWGEPAAQGSFSKGKDEQTVRFDRPQAARFLRFVALSGFDGQPWAAVAELDLVVDEK